MQRIKRILATVLCIGLLGTLQPVDTFAGVVTPDETAAGQTVEHEQAAETGQTEETAKTMENDQAMESTQETAAGQAAEHEQMAETGQTEETAQTAENDQAMESTQAAVGYYQLSYLVVDKPYLTTPDTQTIVVGIEKNSQTAAAAAQTAEPSGDEQSATGNEQNQTAAADAQTAETSGGNQSATGDEQNHTAAAAVQTALTGAVLSVRHTASGKTMEISAASFTEEMAEFTAGFGSEAEDGIYRLLSVCFTYTLTDSSGRTVEGSQTVDFAENGIDASFGVDEQPVTTPDAVVVEEEDEDASGLEADIVTIDENGNVTSQNSIAEALADAAPASDGGLDAVGAGNKVVVLDPGHDSTHQGTHAGDLEEETLVFKIAQYCKAELETYSGVTVYLTRTSYACPYSGTTSTTCNSKRVAYADSVGADIYVALHLNSSDGTAYGAEVYYPNSNGNASVGSAGKQLATQIQDQLVALGLHDRGIKIRNSESGDSFSDGTLKDYYGVIRSAKSYGFPGIIVEHAYQSNTSDVEKFLSSDEGLKKLGVADATGIANYLELTKSDGSPQITKAYASNSTTAKLTWGSVTGATGYAVYRSGEESGGYVKIADVAAESYKDTGLAGGNTYYYKVEAYNSVGTLGESPVEAVTTIVAVPVTKIKGSDSTQATLTWTADAAVDGYQIQRSADGGATYKKIATISKASTATYTDQKLTAKTTYYYRIRAYKKDGSVTNYSSYGTAASYYVLPAAKISKAVSLDSETIQLTYAKVANATGYQIYRSTKKSSGYKKIKTVKGVASTTYEDTEAETGKTYYYKVRAYQKVKGVVSYGTYSAAVSAAALQKMSIQSVSSTDSTKLTVKWKKVSGATGYELQRAASKKGTYKTIATLGASKTSYTNKKLASGTTYYYRIRVVKKVGGKKNYGSYSAVKSGTTPEVPDITSIAAVAGGKLKIKWEEIEGADVYRIYRSKSKNGTYTRIASVSAQKSAVYKDKVPKTNKKYYYKILVEVKGGSSGSYSSYSEVQYGKALSAVTLKEAYGYAAGQIRLTWAKVPGAAGYQVYRSTAKDGTYTKLATVKGASKVTYTDKTAKNNKTYYYKVRAYNSVNGTAGYGSYSAAAKAKAVAGTTLLSAKSDAAGSITLAWTRVNGAYSYEIKRSAYENGTYKIVATIQQGTSSELSYTDKTVKTGTQYYYKVNVRNKVGSVYGESGDTEAFAGIALQQVTIQSITVEGDSNSIKWGKVKGADGYQIYRSIDGATFTKIATVKPGTVLSYTDSSVPGGTVYYKLRAYAKSGGETGYGSYSAVKTASNGYYIMGTSTVTVDQMVEYYNSVGKTYPSDVYKEKGAEDITKFCQIVYDEAEAEGVKAEVVFAQICLETAYLQFGGDVSADQCNFAGIGATGGGNPGETFADVATGIRAQVQHLKAYASTDGLNQECVDPRFSLVTRGSAEIVEWLSIKHNPNGTGWAADEDYGTKLLNIIGLMRAL